MTGNPHFAPAPTDENPRVVFFQSFTQSPIVQPGAHRDPRHRHPEGDGGPCQTVHGGVVDGKRYLEDLTQPMKDKMERALASLFGDAQRNTM